MYSQIKNTKRTDKTNVIFKEINNMKIKNN